MVSNFLKDHEIERFIYHWVRSLIELAEMPNEPVAADNGCQSLDSSKMRIKKATHGLHWRNWPTANLHGGCHLAWRDFDVELP